MAKSTEKEKIQELAILFQTLKDVEWLRKQHSNKNEVINGVNVAIVSERERFILKTLSNNIIKRILALAPDIK